MLYEVITFKEIFSVDPEKSVEAVKAERRDIFREIVRAEAPALMLVELYPRITSYNVCYTKLLRIGRATALLPISMEMPPLSSISRNNFV